MLFINLFLTPMIGLYLFMLKKSFPMDFSVKTLLLYACFTSLNIPAARFFIVIIRKIGLVIESESALYTLIAIISSVIVSVCLLLLTEWLHIELKTFKKND